MMRRAGMGTIMQALLSLLAGGCSGPSCPTDEDFLRELAALGEGDTLVLPQQCEITTGFVVPAGRSVEGGRVILPVDERIDVTPAAATQVATGLSSMEISSSGPSAAIVADGAGSTALRELVIDLHEGTAIAVRGGTTTLTGIEVRGNLDPAALIPLPDTVADYGLFLFAGATATLSDVRISGTANSGLVCSSATIHAEGVTLDGHRGNAAGFYSCLGELHTVTVRNTLSAPGYPGYGIVIARASEADRASNLQIVDLSLEAGPGMGVLVDSSSVTFDHPTVTGLGTAGIFGYTDSSVEIRDGDFAENAGAAIASVGGRALTIERTSVRSTGDAPIPTLTGGGVDLMADGIHVVQLETPLETFVISDSVLEDNSRIGMLLDGGGLTLSPSISAVDASGMGSAFGVVAQNVDRLPAGWDVGVTRTGSPATLDVTAPILPVSSGVSVMGILMPPTIVL